MRNRNLLRIGQAAGAIGVVAGLAACHADLLDGNPLVTLLGAMLYAGCRLAAEAADR